MDNSPSFPDSIAGSPSGNLTIFRSKLHFFTKTWVQPFIFSKGLITTSLPWPCGTGTSPCSLQTSRADCLRDLLTLDSNDLACKKQRRTLYQRSCSTTSSSQAQAFPFSKKAAPRVVLTSPEPPPVEKQDQDLDEDCSEYESTSEEENGGPDHGNNPEDS